MGTCALALASKPFGVTFTGKVMVSTA
ncbi:uncharacterized protein G2W53_011989 [Senna tora]|uniref:Uncharacterized protein n=1 Tax=Senna tora TaxID=362788 RepID=A0A834WRN4_9FABA|nr:uncharacterized protein G2W53_011989 [Senna tora]